MVSLKASPQILWMKFQSEPAFPFLLGIDKFLNGCNRMHPRVTDCTPIIGISHRVIQKDIKLQCSLENPTIAISVEHLKIKVLVTS